MCKEKIHIAFSNMEAILRLFLSLMVTNCSGKRSFSRFKSIKNKLRSTVSQERLPVLSVLCIESEKLKQIKFNKFLHDFALMKARKKFHNLVLLYVMAVTIFYVLVNKFYNYCNGYLIKKLKLKAKLSYLNLYFLIKNLHT